MSRIGKQPIPVPAGVKVTIGADRKVSIQGPLGTLSMTYRPEVTVRWDESEKQIVVATAEADTEDRLARALWGTTRANIRNMIEGVTKGYQKSLEVVGVGWAPSIQGKNLKLLVGFANPILVPIPDGVTVTVDKQFVHVKGADKQLVGQFAAETRAVRKPEPYNGKGIKYTTETVRRKQGKQFGS